MYTIVLVINKHARQQDGMGSGESDSSRPIFRRAFLRGVDHKLIGGLVKCGRSLYTRNECAVSKFGLRIRADDLPFFSKRQPVFDLLLSANQLEIRGEEEIGKAEWITVAKAKQMGSL